MQTRSQIKKKRKKAAKWKARREVTFLTIVGILFAFWLFIWLSCVLIWVAFIPTK